MLRTVTHEAHTFIQLVKETKMILLEIVNRDWVVINLLRITQGIGTIMDFFDEVQDQVNLTREDKKRITKDNLTRITLIAAFRDTS